jgi:hypothetical protein
MVVDYFWEASVMQGSWTSVFDNARLEQGVAGYLGESDKDYSWPGCCAQRGWPPALNDVAWPPDVGKREVRSKSDLLLAWKEAKELREGKVSEDSSRCGRGCFKIEP